MNAEILCIGTEVLIGDIVNTNAAYLGKRGIAVRAGLHCAPLAHESAGTIAQGTVRVSFGHEANDGQRRALVKELAQMR